MRDALALERREAHARALEVKNYTQGLGMLQRIYLVMHKNREGLQALIAIPLGFALAIKCREAHARALEVKRLDRRNHLVII